MWLNDFEKMLFPFTSDDLNISGAYALKDQHLPPSIYKYRDVNSFSLKNLEDDTVWLADPSSFNDPYDSSFTIDFNAVATQALKGQLDDLVGELSKAGKQLSSDEINDIKCCADPMEAIREILLEEATAEQKELLKQAIVEISQKTHRELLHQFKAAILDSFKICSFSEELYSTVMWSHYSKNHTGFCTEYDLTIIPPGDFRTRFLYPVIYTENMFDATRWMATATTDHVNNLYIRYAALHKSVGWAYEKEWRLLFSAGIFDKPRCYPMGKPKALYLGAKISDNDRYNLINVTSTKNIPLFQMELDQNQFKLASKPIADLNT
jgi:hypothetical protein